MCIDFRPLNAITKKDNYLLPRIDEILDSLATAKIYSTLDATSGYYQIEISEGSIEKRLFRGKVSSTNL